LWPVQHDGPAFPHFRSETRTDEIV
jgi:hypothetical protein